MYKYIYLLLPVLMTPFTIYGAPSSEEIHSMIEEQIQELNQRIKSLEDKFSSPDAKASFSINKGNAKDIANWRQLRKGMGEQDVETLLGVADKVEMYSSIFIWYYDYPSGGKVSFNSSRKADGWSEP